MKTINKIVQASVTLLVALLIGLIIGSIISHLGIGVYRLLKKPKGTDTAQIQDALKAQHRADSTQALLQQWKQQRQIDSLTLLLLHRNALDSMRANAGLSDLDAMERINGAIHPKKR